MSQNEVKKMIVFSSVENRRAIEGIVKDISKLDRISESLCIEQALEAALLPCHPEAQWWVKELYTDGSLNLALHRALAYVATCDRMQVVVQRALPLVKFFARLVSQHDEALHREDHEIAYLKNQWDSVVDMLEGKERDHALYLLDKISKGSTTISPELYLETIIDNWEIVCTNNRTFRFLAYLARIMPEELEESPRTRQEYCRLVREMSDAW